MFWGLIMEPNKRYTQIVENPFHLSMACLDAATVTKGGIVQVMICYDQRNYLLCTLQKDKIWQVPLDLNFEEGTKVSFTCNGDGHVHLTGFLIPPDEPMMDLDDDKDEEDDEVEMDDEDDEDQEENEVPALVESKKRKKLDNSDKNNLKRAKVSQNDDENDDDDDDSDSELGTFDSIDSEDVSDDDDEEEEESDDEEDDDDEEEEEEEEEQKATQVIPSKKEKQKQNKQKTEQKQSNQQQQNQSQNKEKNKMVNGKQEKPEKEHSKQKKNKNESKSDDSKVEQQQQQEKKRTIEGGVQVKDLRVGNGAPAKAGRFVSVYYVGRLKNGKKFDATQQGEGFKFRLGKGEVIKGWDVGIAGMKVGGKRLINIPPNMAYGAKGSPPVIPPNSWLHFEVELKNIH